MFGLFFRATIGFAIAVSVLHPGAIGNAIDPARLAALKTDIASQHPDAQLQAAANAFLAQLTKSAAARTGTTVP